MLMFQFATDIFSFIYLLLIFWITSLKKSTYWFDIILKTKFFDLESALANLLRSYSWLTFLKNFFFFPIRSQSLSKAAFNVSIHLFMYREPNALPIDRSLSWLPTTPIVSSIFTHFIWLRILHPDVSRSKTFHREVWWEAQIFRHYWIVDTIQESWSVLRDHDWKNVIHERILSVLISWWKIYVVKNMSW